jgi:Brp/Blh family beta-carotene 15,15'-monooxygenase
MSYLQSSFFRYQVFIQWALIGCTLLLPESYRENFALVVGGLLLAVVGIPHGANDLLYRKNTVPHFLGFYLGTMALYALLWWWQPSAALLIFLIVSIHHFGQSNFENHKIFHAPALLWGTWLLLAPVAIHYQESTAIFSEMTQTHSFPVPTAAALLYLRWGAFVVYLLVALWFYRAAALPLLAQALGIAIWLEITSLISGFIVVFALWHSTQSMHYQWVWHQSQYPQQTKNFWSNLAIFSLLTFGFLGLFAAFVPLTAAILFILLAVVTLPHALVMNNLYNKT